MAPRPLTQVIARAPPPSYASGMLEGPDSKGAGT